MYEIRLIVVCLGIQGNLFQKSCELRPMQLEQLPLFNSSNNIYHTRGLIRPSTSDHRAWDSATVSPTVAYVRTSVAR